MNKLMHLEKIITIELITYRCAEHSLRIDSKRPSAMDFINFLKTAKKEKSKYFYVKLKKYLSWFYFRNLLTHILLFLIKIHFLNYYSIFTKF